VDSPAGPSSANFVTVNRYHVEYIRTDGRNVPGVDVPYAFDGAMTLTVSGFGGSGGLVLVRAQAKLESPLIQLAGASVNAQTGAGVLSTVAKVTFYGADQAGRDVSATGYISVDFANWGDPE
jgi:hypothetical protein